MSKEVPKEKVCNKGDNCVNPDGPRQPIENFSRRKMSPDGRTYACKACEKEQAKRNYHRRKEEGRLQMTPEEHEARKQFYRDYYRANKERKKQYDEQYRSSEKGREVMREGHTRRRQRMKQQAAEPYERWEIFQRDTDENGVLRCQICGTEITRVRDAHLDHIVPIAHGGVDAPDNVRTTCTDCNLNRPKGETSSE